MNNITFPDNCFWNKATIEDVQKVIDAIGINATNEKDESLLFSAIGSASDKIIIYIVEQGADINGAKDCHYSNLAYAIFCFRSKYIIEYLIKSGADVNRVGWSMESPLLVAAERGQESIVQLLLDSGADIHATTRIGYNALMYACIKEPNLQVIDLLLTAGIDIDATDRGGETALMQAVRGQSKYDNVEFLINAGANVHLKNNEGKTALMIAKEDAFDLGVIDILTEVEEGAFEFDETDLLIPYFSKGFQLLDDYDNQRLDSVGKTNRSAVHISTQEFLKVIDKMKPKFASDVFANPKDDSFDSSVNQIYQSIGGQECYPSLEEKATMLLYFIVKNHSFSDGNKRIAASCFLHFLQKNKILYKKGLPIIDNATLAAITLLIAISPASEKESVTKMVLSILNRSVY